MSLESRLQALLLLAAPLALPSVRFFRRNIGKAKLHGHTVQFAIPGQCDLYGVIRGGGHWEIELKGVKGLLSPEQKTWQAWCVEWGVPHIVLQAKKDETDAETIERWIEELRELM